MITRTLKNQPSPQPESEREYFSYPVQNFWKCMFSHHWQSIVLQLLYY